MNLVEMIMKLLGGDVLGKLAGALGAGEEETKKAVSAAVPAMLSGLGSLAAKPDGAKKLWSAVQGVDEQVTGNFAQMLTGGQQDALGKMGGGLLEGLFGQGTLSTLINVLGVFLGGKSALVTKLLPMLAPVILGALAKQVKSGGLDLGGLTKILMGQKDNVVRAMPAGLMNSLSGAQGLGDLAGFAKSASGSVASAARATGAAAAEAASPLRWLLPLILVLAAAAGVYWLVNRPATDATGVKKSIENAVDQASTVTKEFDGLLANMGTALTEVTDIDSAQAALPKLDGMATQLDTLGKAFKALPAASRPALAEAMAAAVKQLEGQRQKIEAIPGVGDILKSILDRIFEKLTAMLKG